MADTPLPLFLPYPRFLLKMEISQTAKLLYSLLLDLSLIHILKARVVEQPGHRSMVITRGFHHHTGLRCV